MSTRKDMIFFYVIQVFSQQHLIPILRNLEQGITDSGTGLSTSLDISYNSSLDQR